MQIEEALEQMYIAEVLAEIAKRLNISIGTSSTFNFRYNDYILHGPIIQPHFFNHPTYTFLVPFTFTARGGAFFLIDFSKIQSALESTIKTYYFSTNITARDVTISLFAVMFEKDAKLQITDEGLTPLHIDILKQNLTIMNQIVEKMINDNLVNQIEKL